VRILPGVRVGRISGNDDEILDVLSATRKLARNGVLGSIQGLGLSWSDHGLLPEAQHQAFS
jgi:hypothetical protein